MSNKTWKDEERRVCRDLGMERNWKGTSGKIPDATDRFLSIEVKNQKGVPKFLYKVLEQAEERKEDEDKIAMGVVRRRGKHTQVAILSWFDFLKIYKIYKESICQELQQKKQRDNEG